MGRELSSFLLCIGVSEISYRRGLLHIVLEEGVGVGMTMAIQNPWSAPYWALGFRASIFGALEINTSQPEREAAKARVLRVLGFGRGVIAGHCTSMEYTVGHFIGHCPGADTGGPAPTKLGISCE